MRGARTGQLTRRKVKAGSPGTHQYLPNIEQTQSHGLLLFVVLKEREEANRSAGLTGR
jgi:hypothetical protein